MLLFEAERDSKLGKFFIKDISDKLQLEQPKPVKFARLNSSEIL